MEKRHLQQAKLWFEAALHTADQETNGEQYAVAVAMTVHAIIKANDALTWKFLNQVARRHDEARLLFEEMIKRGFIKLQFANHRNIIQDAISNKAKAEYKWSYTERHK